MTTSPPDVSLLSNRIRRTWRAVRKGALLCLLIALTFYLATCVGLPFLESHPIDRANSIEYQRNWGLKNGLIVCIAAALAGGFAGFAATFPKHPRSYVLCLTMISLGAAVGRVVAFPQSKGSESMSYLMAVIGALVGGALTMWPPLPTDRDKPDSIDDDSDQRPLSPAQAATPADAP